MAARLIVSCLFALAAASPLLRPHGKAHIRRPLETGKRGGREIAASNATALPVAGKKADRSVSAARAR